MIATSITLRSDQLRHDLLPRLRVRVFHVTTHAAYGRIMTEGVIKANTDPSPLSAPDAYFRSRGCVSVCDLRDVTDDQINLALDAYYFLNPKSRDASPVFLFLAEHAFPCLIPGRCQLEERALDELVVPHVEAGYPGDLKIEFIEDVLIVTVTHPPADEYLQALLDYGGPPDRAD